MLTKYWQLTIVALALSGATMAARASDLVDEEWVLFKIHSTRTLTAHLSIGYDMGSVEKIAKRIKPGDVPALIRLYDKDKDRLGTGLAIVTQCGAGLAGLANMTRIDYDVIELVKKIAASQRCDPSTRDAATEKIADLEVQRIAQNELERRERERKRLESEAKFVKEQQQAWLDLLNRRARGQGQQPKTNAPSEAH